MKWLRKFKRLLSRITGFSTPIGGLQWDRKRPGDVTNQSEIALHFPDSLIEFFWRYPTGDGNQASWAAKESAVLRGQLDSARRDPGLGVAIVTTELALSIFGQDAWNRVQETCIRWAIGRTDTVTPHFVKVELLDPITSRREFKPDFRHTLALAVILARTRTQYGYLKEYIETVLASQREDGGWAPGLGKTISEVFTVLYAAELLYLSTTDSNLETRTRSACESSLNRSIAWLLANRSAQGLWDSGVLTEYTWDDLQATAWIIHRLAPLHHVNPGWNEGLQIALHNMVQRTMQRDFWLGNNFAQRNRVEARIAAAVVRAKKLIKLKEQENELIDLYLSSWRNQAIEWLKSTTYDMLDVGTVAFLLQALWEESELIEVVRKMFSKHLIKKNEERS